LDVGYEPLLKKWLTGAYERYEMTKEKSKKVGN